MQVYDHNGLVPIETEPDPTRGYPVNQSRSNTGVELEFENICDQSMLIGVFEGGQFNGNVHFEPS